MEGVLSFSLINSGRNFHMFFAMSVGTILEYAEV
jgi:hypothetical protein